MKVQTNLWLGLLCGAVLLAGCGEKKDDAGTASTGSPEAATTSSDAPAPAPSTDSGTTGDSTASAGIEGAYTATGPDGSKMTVTLAGDSSFEMSGAGGSGKGTYAHEGDQVTLTVSETNGKPASEEDKKRPLVLTVDGDGNLSAAAGGPKFVKQ